MPRHARVICPGFPHHVTQRGNHRNRVFFSRGDGLAYIQMLRECSLLHAVEIVAYCLMPNHVHLVLVPSSADALHRALKVVHGRYAQRINRIRGQIGHFWQDRYFSSPLDSSYFLNAVRYVELNPVRAKIVDRAESYEWSSASAHCGLHSDPLVASKPRFTELNGIGDWSQWLASGLAQTCVDALRKCASQNLPCGSPDFVAELERLVGRRLQYQPRGRPPKSEAQLDECTPL